MNRQRAVPTEPLMHRRRVVARIIEEMRDTYGTNVRLHAAAVPYRVRFPRNGRAGTAGSAVRYL
jgi:hypothetical protein